ncbi:MAG TPA: phage tail protein, partial [Anaerolineae bacterium]
FRAGGEIRFDVEPANTLEELFKACNGRLAEIGGTYKVRAGAPGSAVFSFTDGDILSTEQQTFDPFPSLGQTINAVTAKYISPAEGYVAKDAPPLYDATLETADGGRRQAVDVNYSFVTSGTQVQRLMRAERDTHRAMRSHALPMPPEAFVLEPLDVISWTSTRNGYSSKLFEITSAEDLPNLNMGLAIKEIDPNAYDWVAATDEAPIVDGTIVVTRPPAQPIVDWAAVPWTILSDGVQSRPGIKLSWNASTEDVDGVLFEIRLASSGEVVHRGATDGFSAGSIIISQNLLFSTAYQARGQYRPISAREVSWSSWLDITTFDIRTVVAALDDALNRHITTQLAETQSLLKKTQDLIASLSADQGAANWLDKRGTKTAITASFGSAYAAIISEETVRVAADAALASRTTTLETFVNDPTTGLSTRASASDVTTLQSLTGHATYGNVALGTRTTTLETSVNDPTTGLSTRASASDVTALESLTGDVTHGNLALATRALSVEANLNGP